MFWQRFLPVQELGGGKVPVRDCGKKVRVPRKAAAARASICSELTKC